MKEVDFKSVFDKDDYDIDIPDLDLEEVP